VDRSTKATLITYNTWIQISRLQRIYQNLAKPGAQWNKTSSGMEQNLAKPGAQWNKTSSGMEQNLAKPGAQ